MSNRSPMTRGEQVLDRLRQEHGGWVDGPELANERVGGSEGLRRVRELRQDGYSIEERKHPDPRRDIFQYRLMSLRQPKGVVAGQTPAFFTSDPVVAEVPTGHPGTQLDPTWTVAVGNGWYDQSVRIFQTHVTMLPGDLLGVRAADLALVMDKTDWVECIGQMDTAWQIPTKRLIDNGVGIMERDGRYVGAPLALWRELNATTSPAHSNTPSRS